MSKRYWIAVKTKQASSRDAIVNVRNQDYEYFHLTFRTRAVRGIRKVHALFPFYLIVRVDLRKNDPRVLHSTKGIKGIVGRVDEDSIRYFKSCTEKTDPGVYRYSDPAHDYPKFEPGQRVVGLRGLFDDKYGTYRGLAGNSAARVRVLFSILGREAEFELPSYDLASAA